MITKFAISRSLFILVKVFLKIIKIYDCTNKKFICGYVDNGIDLVVLVKVM